jgi:hypothetical protein
MTLIFKDRWEFMQAAKGKESAQPGSLMDIYDAMMHWQDALPKDKGICLYLIYRACKAFIHSFRPLMITSRLQSMLSAVTILRASAWDEALRDPELGMQLQLYIVKKPQARKNVPLKQLEPGYAHERTTYELHGKTTPPRSATEVRDYLRDPSDSYAQQVGRVAALSPQEFEAKAERYNLARMYWCDRMTRLRHKAFYRGTKGVNGWEDIQGITLSHQKAAPYAMDRYGNLFFMEVKGTGLRGFNHSSFCAGKGVICAGMLWFYEGYLLYIDNDSGHYKPTRDNLRNAVLLLSNDYQVPLNYLKVGVRSPQKQDLEYYGGTQFVTNSNGPPDWTPVATDSRCDKQNLPDWNAKGAPGLS